MRADLLDLKSRRQINLYLISYDVSDVLYLQKTWSCHSESTYAILYSRVFGRTNYPMADFLCFFLTVIVIHVCTQADY